MSFLLHTTIALLIVTLLPHHLWLALLLAFLSHWILDVIPHYTLPPTVSKKITIILGIIDLTSAAALTAFFIIFVSPISIPFTIGAALLAISPDFFYIIDILWGKKFLESIFFDWHTKIQNEYPWAWVIELIFFGIITFLLFARLV